MNDAAESQPVSADRETIAVAAGVTLNGAPFPTAPTSGPERPPSVMSAQAAALRSQLAALVDILELESTLPEGQGIPRSTLVKLLRIQLLAGIAQVDSFIVMAEAMSSMMTPGARPVAPTLQPETPKVFGGGRSR